MKYDYKNDIDNLNGFYEWNKKHFFIDKNDNRYKKNQDFKKENGFYPDECWNLYNSIKIFILPRLKYFRNTTIGTPCEFKNHKDWLKILDKMIWSFENADHDVPDEYIKKYNDDYQKASKIFYKKVHEGLSLFADYFLALWW